MWLLILLSNGWGFENVLMWIVVLFLFSLLSILFTPQLLTLQARMGIRDAAKTLERLKEWADESRRISLNTLSKYGRPKRDFEKDFDSFLEFFTIEPVSDDPVGVLQRLDHLLDVRKKRFEGMISALAPKADPETAASLEMVVEAAMASNFLFRLVRHYLLLAEKTKSYQLAMLIQMQAPLLREYGRAYFEATKVFAENKPIGDGAGPLVVARMGRGLRWKEGVEEMVYAEKEFEGRKLILIKARGPGGRVGKPGEMVEWLVRRKKPARIIMIDAALKLEGERSGEVIEGVGAAIGGPPTEKYKIEQVAVKHKIPLDAIVIKESFREAITSLNSRIASACDQATELVEEAVRKRTKPGDTVIVAGIGNTIGIGQEKLPEEFPPPVEEKGAIESGRLF
jgi:hypothetical protein